MAGFVFNRGAYSLLANSVTWTETSSIQARLVTAAAGAPAVDADAMTGIGTGEASGTVSLSSLAGPTLDDANDIVKYSSANIVFSSAALAIGQSNAISIFKWLTDDAGSIPLAYVEISTVTPNGGDITVTCPANGWFYTDQQP